MSSPTYQIRLAQPTELPLLGNVERAAGNLFLPTKHSYVAAHEPMDLAELVEAQRHHRLWIAADDAHHPVGFALAETVDGLGHLHELSVHRAHGQRGLGTRLIAAVCEWAIAQGYLAITLSTFSEIE